MLIMEPGITQYIEHYPPILTLKEAARILSTRESTVIRFLEEQKIRGELEGGEYRIERESLHRLIQERNIINRI